VCANSGREDRGDTCDAHRQVSRTSCC
jgi:hypothetical protein